MLFLIFYSPQKTVYKYTASCDPKFTGALGHCENTTAICDTKHFGGLLGEFCYPRNISTLVSASNAIFGWQIANAISNDCKGLNLNTNSIDEIEIICDFNVPPSEDLNTDCRIWPNQIANHSNYDGSCIVNQAGISYRVNFTEIR